MCFTSTDPTAGPVTRLYPSSEETEELGYLMGPRGELSFEAAYAILQRRAQAVRLSPNQLQRQTQGASECPCACR